MIHYLVVFLKDKPQIDAKLKVAYVHINANTPEDAEKEAELWLAVHQPDVDYDELYSVAWEQVEEE